VIRRVPRRAREPSHALASPGDVHAREHKCPPRSIAPVHSLVEQVAVVEVYASEYRAPLRQKPGTEIAHETAHGTEIVPQCALDQARQRIPVLGSSRLGFANQAIIEIQGRLHTEIWFRAATRVNFLDDTTHISGSQGCSIGERPQHTALGLTPISIMRPAPSAGSLLYLDRS